MAEFQWIKWPTLLTVPIDQVERGDQIFGEANGRLGIYTLLAYPVKVDTLQRRQLGDWEVIAIDGRKYTYVDGAVVIHRPA